MKPLIKITALFPQYTVNKTLSGTNLTLHGWKVRYEVITTNKGLGLITGEVNWNKHPADIKEITKHIEQLLEQLND
jgi:hypothetical protein